MADILVALKSRLTTQVGDGRFYPVTLPQSPTLPATALTVIAGERFHNFGSDSAVKTTVVQATSWGETRQSAKTRALAVETALSRCGKFTVSTVTVDDAWVETDQIEQGGFNDEVRGSRVDQDFIVVWRE